MYKVYKIIDRKSDNVYIGISKNINHRFRQHKYAHKNKKQECSAKIIFNNEDWYYEIIEETNDKSRERFWIQNTPNCINQQKLQWGCSTTMSPEKKAEYRKYYYEGHKKQEAEYQKKIKGWKNSWGGNFDSNGQNNLLRIDFKSVFN